MNWWRAHHGISNDPKLAVVALRCGAKRCEVLAVWVTLLDFASQNKPDRGSTLGMDAEQIAIMSDLTEKQVSDILGHLTQRGLIQQDGFLASWTKRQPAREREDEVSTDRVRRFRDKKRHETPESDHETPRNAERRGEEKREEEKSQTPCAADAALEHKTARDTVELAKRRPQKIWFDQQHDLWYSDAYWCHKGKANSRKAYEKAINRQVDRGALGYNQAVLMLRAKAVEDRQRFESTEDWTWRINLLPASWLNQERWTDEVGPEVHKLTVHQERHEQTLDTITALGKLRGW